LKDYLENIGKKIEIKKHGGKEEVKGKN